MNQDIFAIQCKSLLKSRIGGMWVAAPIETTEEWIIPPSNVAGFYRNNGHVIMSLRQPVSGTSRFMCPEQHMSPILPRNLSFHSTGMQHQSREEDRTININDNVTIKLTRLGRRILSQLIEDLCTGNEHATFRHLIPEENGTITFPLWKIMEIFGPHLNLGCAMAFEPTMVVKSNA